MLLPPAIYLWETVWQGTPNHKEVFSRAVDFREFRFVRNSLAKPTRLFRDFRAAVPGRGGRNGVTVFVKEK